MSQNPKGYTQYNSYFRLKGLEQRCRSKPHSDAVILGSHKHRVAVIKQDPTNRARLETVGV